MELLVTQLELDCVERVINRGQLGQNLVTAESWLQNNLRSLIKQCIDSELQDKLNELGKLTDAEIEMIKSDRALKGDVVI